MDILIFKTVNEERTKRLLNSIDTLNNNVYIVMPESEISIYSGLGLNIYCIGTNKKYIDYKTIMKENQIPDIKFREIWVPSPYYSKIDTYWEVYAVISGLKYCRVCYKVIETEEIVNYDLKKEKIFSRTHDLMVSAVKIYSVLLYGIEKRVRGCK